MPSWTIEAHDGILAVDIGGTNIRAGVVASQLRRRRPAKAAVWKSELWRHGDDEPKRDEAVDRLIHMIEAYIGARRRKPVASPPWWASAVPASSTRTARSKRAHRTFPGNWESSRFNLPARIRDKSPPSASTRPPSSSTTMPSCKAERPAPHGRLRALGRADDRHRSGQRPLHDPHHVVLGVDAVAAGEAAGRGAAGGIGKDRVRAAAVVPEDVQINGLQLTRQRGQLDIAEDAAERAAAGARARSRWCCRNRAPCAQA